MGKKFMHYLYASFCLFLFTFSYAFSVEDSAPTIKSHPLQLLLEQVDKHPWKLAYDGDVGTMITKWFVHTNEDTENAPEIFTFHYLPAADKVSCEEYYRNFMASIRLANSNTLIHSEVIHTTDDSMFWQWKLEAQGEEQIELVFARKYGKALTVYRYTTKHTNDNDLKKWRDFISIKLQKNRFLCEREGYRLWLPNMWQISEIISPSSNETVEFFAPCDYSINVWVKSCPKLEGPELANMKSLFRVDKYESQETISLNKGTATLYTFGGNQKNAFKKLIAKIEYDQKAIYLYAGMTQDNFAKNKEEYLAILKSFEPSNHSDRRAQSQTQ